MQPRINIDTHRYIRERFSMSEEVKEQYTRDLISKVDAIDPVCFLRKAMLGAYDSIHGTGRAVFVARAHNVSQLAQETEVTHIWNARAIDSFNKSGKDFAWDHIPAIQLNRRYAPIETEGVWDKTKSDSSNTLVEGPHVCWFILEYLKKGFHFWLNDGEGTYTLLA